MGLRNPKLLIQSSTTLLEGIIKCKRGYRSSTRSKFIDLRKLRPMILQRIENRAKDYPVNPMIPVAQEVLNARSFLYQGVSTLLHRIPLWACKYCPEVYIGENGHLIRTCGGYRRSGKNQLHTWIKGTLNDILVPVETFHLHHMFQNVIEHNQRFDYNRISAVVELCLQAGAEQNNFESEDGLTVTESLSDTELRHLAVNTLKAWETVRYGVKKLLLVYPVKVCKYCSEVHVGISGHKARLCGVFKYESWRGTHYWEKAKVDHLVPPKIVWFRRPQDPPLLRDEGRNFYGHAPAVVDLCAKAGIVVPTEYFCMMKVEGLTAPM